MHWSTRLRSSGSSKIPASVFSPAPPSGARSAVNGNAAVRRIDDERRATVCGQLIAALIPEIVVGEHAALRARRVAGARLAFLRIE
jgi:hypothetical protein